VLKSVVLKVVTIQLNKEVQFISLGEIFLRLYVIIHQIFVAPTRQTFSLVVGVI
jgi:hypothetical protein